jgi:cellulose synthase/poly-beta-1,6-N-acetylglucosamine synthase-like glycosyltransferase
VTAQPLFLSVIVPVYNASRLLPAVLGGLLASDLPRERFELIVVDDGSADDTATQAARSADTVIRLPGPPNGPAYARNRGFELSRGEVVVFIDADVVVHTDTLRRFVEIFEQHDDVGAVCGSYDADPPEQGLMSQYRNLVHHHVHHQNAGDVDTFFAGVGAVRRDVFAEAGMYDEWHFARPQIEDIELGARIRGLGKRILLQPEIQGTHCKAWTLASVLRTDLRDRGIPWARLLAHRGSMLSSATLNLRWTEKLNTVLVWLALLLAGAVIWTRRPTLGIASLVCVAIVIALNVSLWRFFIRVRGVWFTIRVIPAHLMYYLMNGVSFGTGLLLQHLVGPPLREPAVEASSEVGTSRWPPVPSRHRPSSWTANER